MIDPHILLAAGINPKTGLPIKIDKGGIGCINLKPGIKNQLKIIDEQDAINRYTWYNLPRGLTPQLMERVLYFRGQAMLFMLGDKFCFLPYALSAPEDSVGIDMYGRFTGVTPLPFNGTDEGDKKKSPFRGMIWEPVYDVPDLMDFKDKSEDEIRAYLKKSCVLFKDYVEGISQTIVARTILNDPILDVMSDCIPFMRTAMLNSTGVSGMRVNSEDEYSNVYAANQGMYNAALQGKPKIPIEGKQDFQDLNSGTYGKAEEFLLALQSLDNYRLSTHGLESGGLFQKRSHMLEAEQQMNANKVGLVYTDGLRIRQQGCIIANSIWGTSMWVEPSEAVANADISGEGVIGTGETIHSESSEPNIDAEGDNEDV